MWRCGKRSNQRTDELTERGKRGHDRHDFLRGGIKIRGQGGQRSERVDVRKTGSGKTVFSVRKIRRSQLVIK